jgi:hypothetical protein
MINSKFVSNSPFKVFFLPWNSSGLASARLSIKEDQCPSPPWYHVGRKRKKNNLEQHHHLSSSRSCILVKSVFSRLVFPNPNSSSRAEDPSKSVWISSRPKVSKFHSFADAVKSPVHILTGANAVLLVKISCLTSSFKPFSRCHSEEFRFSNSNFKFECNH